MFVGGVVIGGMVEFVVCEVVGFECFVVYFGLIQVDVSGLLCSVFVDEYQVCVVGVFDGLGVDGVVVG